MSDWRDEDQLREDQLREEIAQNWDKDDPRRQHDQMAPPKDPCECWCMHCQRVFTSDGIWFQRVIGDKKGFEGFWMCPTPNCSGAGFTFDIWPTDPDHPANASWSYDDDDGDDGGEYEPDEDDEDYEEYIADVIATDGDDDEADAPADYDPAESKYAELEEINAGLPDEGDIEGEEWKFGLQPGEVPNRPPTPRFSSEESRKEWEAEQARYDGLDERPRELDWSSREDDATSGEADEITEDDIPF